MDRLAGMTSTRDASGRSVTPATPALAEAWRAIATAHLPRWTVVAVGPPVDDLGAVVVIRLEFLGEGEGPPDDELVWEKVERFARQVVGIDFERDEWELGYGPSIKDGN